MTAVTRGHIFFVRSYRIKQGAAWGESLVLPDVVGIETREPS